jgi:ABC-type amino acid transport substrate-binding protein
MMTLKIIILLVLGITTSYAQTLSVGITGSNPPFSDKVDQHNHFFGFDIEIMDQICKQMKAECHYVTMPYDDLFSAIENGKIDLAIDSIMITPDRQQKYLFSQPYLTSRERFMTNQSSPIKTTNDLKNKRVGVRQLAPFEPLFNVLNENIAEIVYPHMTNLLEGLANKKVDAILINNISAEYWSSNNNNQYKLIGDPIPLGDGFGIMAKMGRDKLIYDVNKAIQAIQADGTYKRIYKNYWAW